MSDSLASSGRRFLLALSVGLALLAGWNVLRHLEPGGLGTDIAGKVAIATKEYRYDLAAIADKYAESPKKTVSETMEAIRVEGEAARTKFRAKLSAAMEPELGSTELDPAKAKKVFSEVADGFRR